MYNTTKPERTYVNVSIPYRQCLSAEQMDRDLNQVDGRVSIPYRQCLSVEQLGDDLGKRAEVSIPYRQCLSLQESGWI